MAIYQKLRIVIIVALNGCRALKLVVGQLVLGQQKTAVSSGHQIFAIPELQSKQRGARLFGAGYTEYQPEIIFLQSW